jgi:hypothetical protein
LRFLYSLPRWSEDLDFALERPSPDYNFRTYLASARSELAKEGYAVDLAAVKTEKVVHSAFVRFPGLLHELGLSAHRDENVAVKLEVDTRPPGGAELEVTVVRRHLLMRLQHHSRASLFAGKLHAVLQREYPKGRDLYDLVWYLADPAWPAPNLALLNAALQQTGWKGPSLEVGTWRRAIRGRLTELDWSRVEADVRPFLERREEISLLKRESLLSLLQDRSPPGRDDGGR